MKTPALIIVISFFAVAQTAASFDERRQSAADRMMMCQEALGGLQTPLMLSATCEEYLGQIAMIDLGNLTNACVQSCIGQLCTAYNSLGNENDIKLCSDPLVSLCASRDIQLDCGPTVATTSGAETPATLLPLLGFVTWLSTLL